MRKYIARNFTIKIHFFTTIMFTITQTWYPTRCYYLVSECTREQQKLRAGYTLVKTFNIPIRGFSARYCLSLYAGQFSRGTKAWGSSKHFLFALFTKLRLAQGCKYVAPNKDRSNNDNQTDKLSSH